MTGQQTILEIAPETLRRKVRGLKRIHHRLVQISCVWRDGAELTYSFDCDYNLTHLRVNYACGQIVDSIGDLFSYAFLYESELKDLFGLEFRNLVAESTGQLYHTSVKTPFVSQSTQTEVNENGQ